MVGLSIETLNIGWMEYIEKLHELRRIVAGGDPEDIDVIVGLVRGGLWPGTYLSHQMNLPFVSFEPHALHSDGTERAPLEVPLFPPIVRKVLITDDIADSGTTLEKCSKFFNSRGLEVLTAAVYYAERSKIRPNFWVSSNEGKWIVFPYERRR